MGTKTTISKAALLELAEKWLAEVEDECRHARSGSPEDELMNASADGKHEGMNRCAQDLSKLLELL